MAETQYSLLLSELGLPESKVQDELGPLIEKTGKSADQLGLEDLRAIACEFLQDTFSELKDELEGEASAV